MPSSSIAFLKSAEPSLPKGSLRGGTKYPLALPQPFHLARSFSIDYDLQRPLHYGFRFVNHGHPAYCAEQAFRLEAPLYRRNTRARKEPPFAPQPFPKPNRTVPHGSFQGRIRLWKRTTASATSSSAALGYTTPRAVSRAEVFCRQQMPISPGLIFDAIADFFRR